MTPVFSLYEATRDIRGDPRDDGALVCVTELRRRRCDCGVIERDVTGESSDKYETTMMTRRSVWESSSQVAD